METGLPDRGTAEVADVRPAVSPSVPLYAGYPAHPAADLFPLLEGEEFDALVASVREHGLIESIVLYDGRIIDGRNRARACEAAGVAPRFKPWGGGDSQTAWVIAKNLFRRHLTPSQRAVVAVEALPLFEAEAAERKAATLFRQGREPGHGNFPGPLAQGAARDLAAKTTEANPRYVSDLKAAAKTAPDILPAVRDGSLNVPQARTVSRLPVGQRAAVIAKVKSGAPASEVVKDAVREAAKAEVVADARGRTIPPEVVEAWTEVTTWAKGVERDLVTGEKAWGDRHAALDRIAKPLGRLPLVKRQYDILSAHYRQHVQAALVAIRESIPQVLCDDCGGKGCRECGGIGWLGRTDAKRAKESRETSEKMRKQGKM